MFGEGYAHQANWKLKMRNSEKTQWGGQEAGLIPSGISLNYFQLVIIGTTIYL